MLIAFGAKEVKCCFPIYEIHGVISLWYDVLSESHVFIMIVGS